MKLYFVTAVLWIGTVTATLESDSRGNWSNEKNETRADSQSKQIVQPYVLSPNVKSTPEAPPEESVDLKPRTSQNPVNETAEEILIQDSSTTPKYFSAPSNNNSSYTISKERIDVQNVGDFGQRVRPSVSRQRANENRVRSRQSLDSVPSTEDFRKQQKKNSRLLVSKKLNVSENTVNASSKVSGTPEDRLPVAKPTEKTSKQRESEEDVNDYFQNNKLNSQIIPWAIDEDVLESSKREYKPRKHYSEQEKSSTKSALGSTSTPLLSLGKFSGPIVVADFPKPSKYSYSTDIETDQTPKVTLEPLEPTTKPKPLGTGYLAASPVVLSPLQVGVALMNAGQDINSVNDPPAPGQDYLRDTYQDGDAPQGLTSDTQESIQSDAAYSDSSDVQQDQVTQQEQISEVVETNSPLHSVEIQKSVEVFHTAPIQEIHYPMEYVPHFQSTLIKQRPQEDFRKLQKGLKVRRPGQVNVYKSNEIVDEVIPLINRYEYNVNDNDVYLPTIADQVRPGDVKPAYSVREQPDNGPFEQSMKQSRVQGSLETIPKEASKTDFDLAKGQSVIISQSSRVSEGSSPDLANLEAQEGPQSVLLKANDQQTELRLLMTAPQAYPVEKVIEKTVHVPHAVDVVEKKVPYPIEKVIEKQITIPQPFPVHVPIDRVVEKQIRIPYPVHVEKVIEKKVPYAIQRLIIPYPIHYRVPQPVPIAVEKIVEKPAPVPYALEVEKSIERRPYLLESPKILKSIALPVYDRNFQQIRPLSYQTSGQYGFAGDEQGHYNQTQFYSLDYAPVNRPLARQPLLHALPKKFGTYGVQYPHLVASYLTLNGNGNSLSYGRTHVEKDKVKDEYVGPVPRQGSLGLQSKVLQYASPDMQSTLRRTRQESGPGNTGSFRQSKMEYGFKPPMVPSVQYDEQTATKVE